MISKEEFRKRQHLWEEISRRRSGEPVAHLNNNPPISFISHKDAELEELHAKLLKVYEEPAQEDIWKGQKNKTIQLIGVFAAMALVIACGIVCGVFIWNL